jgi:hypothetical protein
LLISIDCLLIDCPGGRDRRATFKLARRLHSLI